MKNEQLKPRYTVINHHPSEKMTPEESARLKAEITADAQNTIYRMWRAGTLFKDQQKSEG